MSEHQKTSYKMRGQNDTSEKETHLSSQEAREQAILGRVREKAVLAYRAKQREKREEMDVSRPVAFAWWRSWSLAGAGLGLGALLFFWLGGRETALHLKTEGVLGLQYSQRQPHRQAFRLQVPQGKSGRFSAPKHWEVEAFGGTSVAVKRRFKRMELQLKQGRLQVHVHPKTMKHFSIRFHRGYRLLVRGTRFSVEQSPTWLYVEVQRGKVEIQRPQQSALLLKAGQGLRVHFGQRQSSTYPVPQKVKDPVAKMAMLLKEKPALLLRYVQDLAQSPGRSGVERRQLVDLAAGMFHRARMYREESALWLLAADLGLYAPQTTFALYAGCQSCLLRKSFVASCRKMCRRFLSENRDKHTQKHVLYRMATRWLQSKESGVERHVKGICEEYQRVLGAAGPFDAQMGRLCSMHKKSPVPRK